MGNYLNSIDACTMYEEVHHSPYFVDKSKILCDIIPRIETTEKYICITRPRRFGKTITANMIGAFFSKACDCGQLFQDLEISSYPDYRKHLNQHNVIYIDFSEIDDECESYRSYIQTIKVLLKEDLYAAYSDICFRKNASIQEDFKRIYMHTHDKFIFVLDEWDAIFHASFITEEDKKSYLLFLKGLLKGKPYVSLAYMTGILPIAKYSSGSELNMFLEYTMTSEELYSDCFGFTESEVDILYERYLKLQESPKITREELRIWYDGYHTQSGERVYNPRSVVASLTNNNLGNYWTSAGPYDEIFYYIEQNVDAVRDDLAFLVADLPIAVNIREYAATCMELTTKDEIFSAMVVYGFLSYEDGYVRIPNKELMDKFNDMLQKEPSLGYIYNLARESERLLKATLAGDTETICHVLEYAHNTEIPLLSYNQEADLTAVVSLAYLSARNRYTVEREAKGGIGYVDFLFTPNNPREDCLILELKVDDTAEHALEQIKKRQYALRFMPKLGEKIRFTGRILAIGISYDKASKQHHCKFEILREVI